MDSITLPFCWVCGVRFTDSLPPGPANKEVHHIIPRAAGGSDGPTVTICETHHGKLHKIANCMSSGKPHFSFVSDETPEQKQKLYWLASRVFNAFQLTDDDPNKQVMVIMNLDRKQQLMIDRLRKVYPKARGREALLAFALDSLYSKHFLQ
jgi:hypothetical protein